MHAIELSVNIDYQYQIFCNYLKQFIQKKAEYIKTKNKPINLGLFQAKIEMSDDFNGLLLDNFCFDDEVFV
jgi:hypothetical protein